MPTQESEMPITSTGFSPFFFVPFALIGLLFYGLIFFCIWKFYQMLSRINDNIAGINANMAGIRLSAAVSERMAAHASSDAAEANTPPLKVQQCPGCGLRVIPTAEGRCPSCQTPIA
jgi:hypothetical protein